MQKEDQGWPTRKKALVGLAGAGLLGGGAYAAYRAMGRRAAGAAGGLPPETPKTVTSSAELQQLIDMGLVPQRLLAALHLGDA